MRSDPASERVERVATAQALVERLFFPPPVRQADFVALFRDRTLGERIWQRMEQKYSPFGGARVTPVETEPDTFLVEDGQLRIRVRLEPGKEEYEIVSFELQ